MEDIYFENEYANFWMKNEIIGYTFKPHVREITIDIARIMVNDRLRLSNGISRPLFVDLSGMVSVDFEARKYMSQGDALKNISATAILVKNQITKLLASVYIRINKPSIPTKFFDNKEDALRWLERYRHLN